MTRLLSIAACALVLVLTPAFAAADQIYLDADFNDKTIDAPIGMGGAAIGEPVSIEETLVSAIVRAGPMGSPGLEVRDVTDLGAGSVRFEFLDSVELTTGIVDVSFDLWFYQIDAGWRNMVYVREQGSSAHSFLNLNFEADGSVSLSDVTGSLLGIGSYETGRSYRVVIEFNMDAAVYDLWLDGALAIDDRPHGVTGRGIGAILFACDYDPDMDSYYSVDALRVSDFFESTAMDKTSWGRIRALYRR